MEIDKETQERILKTAKKAAYSSRYLRSVDTQKKKDALLKIADNIDKKTEDIIFRNSIDVEAAKEDGLK